jgi:flagellar assembly protein FliH
MSSRARRVPPGNADPYDWGDSGPLAVPGQRSPIANAPPRQVETIDEQTLLSAIERDAFAKGYSQGERAGAEAAGKRGEAMLRRLAATLDELTTLRAEMIRRTERQMVQLAMAIARRILDREVAVDRGLIVALARVALDRLGEQASAKIRLHPDDYAAVAAGRSTTESGQVAIVADPSVSRGGCLVESDFGFLDVGVDAQFGELAHTLLGDTDPAGEPQDGTAGDHAFVRGR